jgi:hypothetical protein
MFERLMLHDFSERSIVLQTRLGRPITNVIDVEADDRARRKWGRLLAKHGWTERKAATGGYNCVGHVFASRRTGVFDDLEEQLEKIFVDDGYRVVRREDEVLMPGDLVTYWMPNGLKSTFLHIGMIVEMREGVIKSSLRIPWVLSKMDSTSGEALHHFSKVEFIAGVQHRVEFWTDRGLPERNDHVEIAS